MAKLGKYLCVLALSVPSAALAQSANPAPSGPKHPSTTAAKTAADQAKSPQTPSVLSDADAHVLLDLHNLNQGEIKMGGLAETKAVSADVKGFAHHLVEDHKSSDETVVGIAKRHLVEFPALTPTETQAAHAKQEQALFDRLGTLTGQDFEREFINAMMEGHRNAITMVEQSENKVQNTHLRNLLVKTRPVLKQHFDAAQKLSQSRVTKPKATKM